MIYSNNTGAQAGAILNPTFIQPAPFFHDGSPLQGIARRVLRQPHEGRARGGGTSFTTLLLLLLFLWNSFKPVKISPRHNRRAFMPSNAGWLASLGRTVSNPKTPITGTSKHAQTNS